MSVKTCYRCGRTGTRGFWVQIRVAPEPNRILCNDYKACTKRVDARAKVPA